MPGVVAGFYGKLPARGDFVRAGLPRDFIDPWDAWLQSVIAGSRTLVQSLLAAGLVDEINLQVFPLLLGSGARLYPETTDQHPLRLVSSQALDSGVILQTYAVLADQT